MNNYPIGADTSDAPWNQVDPEPKKIKVTVSITLSKTVEVEVTDYTVKKEFDEDGYRGTSYDFSECNLKQAVRDQIALPNDNDWVEDDFEVIWE